MVTEIFSFGDHDFSVKEMKKSLLNLNSYNVVLIADFKV